MCQPGPPGRGVSVYRAREVASLWKMDETPKAGVPMPWSQRSEFPGQHFTVNNWSFVVKVGVLNRLFPLKRTHAAALAALAALALPPS